MYKGFSAKTAENTLIHCFFIWGKEDNIDEKDENYLYDRTGE